jgi:hypothetical protein
VAALVEWSGAVCNGYDQEPDLHDQAHADGYVRIGSDSGGFKLSVNWLGSIEQSHPLTDLAGFTGPVLATPVRGPRIPGHVDDQTYRGGPAADRLVAHLPTRRRTSHVGVGIRWSPSP